MSRIGKQVITIPERTEVNVEDGIVVVKGPLGELSKILKKEVKVVVLGKEVKLEPTEDTQFANALWGTYAAHVKNMIQGVNQAYEKKLVIEGVGYKSDISGENLVLTVGFSHPVNIEIPNGLNVSVEKNVISISGPDKEMVGQFAASVRSVKKPEPYKGKGIRYDDEVVRRKQGKKAVT